MISMRQSTLLISSSLLEALSDELFRLKISLRDFLHLLLSDRDLWRKMELLKSGKFTKTYQSTGLGLVPVKFYPLPEDWCELSALSNGSGFSRCYIFVYLLKYYLKILSLDEVTTQKVNKDNKAQAVFCRVKMDRNQRILRRTIKPIQNHPRIKPIINTICLKTDKAIQI